MAQRSRRLRRKQAEKNPNAEQIQRHIDRANELRREREQLLEKLFILEASWREEVAAAQSLATPADEQRT